MDFHCTPCSKTFARDPNPHETPFEVPGVEGIFLSGFKVRAVGGRMVVESAACPQCGGSAPRSYCTAKPIPGSHPGAPCVDCGHAMVLHIGCEHCPVCEMADLNGRARTALDTARVELTVKGKPLTEAGLADMIRRMRGRGTRA